MSQLNQLIKAEWIKLRSLRSSKWTIFALVVVTVGLGALFSALTAHHWSDMSAEDRRTWDPTNVSLAGAAFGQLAVAVFGVLAVWNIWRLRAVSPQPPSSQASSPQSQLVAA